MVGNIHEPNLGMDIITAQKIAQEIDLIVDSAANTTFDERLIFFPFINKNIRFTKIHDLIKKIICFPFYVMFVDMT